MATIINPEEIKVTNQKSGWVETTLADAQVFNYPAMVARRWSFEPSGRSPEYQHNETELFLYVISGSGIAIVNGDDYPLDDEAVLWVEANDKYYLEAGADGLEILLGFAPGE